MTSGNTIVLNDSNFKEAISDKQRLVIVDFWAPWCAPCRAVAPVLERLAGEYPDNLTIGKLNVDENQDAAFQNGISSIPTIQFYKNGALVETLIGSRPYQEFKAAVEKHL